MDEAEEQDVLFCMCNAREGEIHPDYCPYPYYGANKNAMDRWGEAAQAKQDALNDFAALYLEEYRI